MDELDQIAQQAKQVDNAANPQPTTDLPTEPTAGTVSLAQELAMFFNVVLPMLTPALPSLKQIYTPDVVTGLCDATAKVCQKHGWFADGIGGKYAEEIALGAIVLPLGFATYQGVTVDIARLKAPKSETNAEGSN